MKKLLLSLSMLACAAGVFAQEKPFVFEFLAGDGMFYRPEIENNKLKLDQLSEALVKYESLVKDGSVKVYVDGFSGTRTSKSNKGLSFVRANRVKSEMVTGNGYVDSDFLTRNFVGDYYGHKDVVVVWFDHPREGKDYPTPRPDEVVIFIMTEESEVIVEPAPAPVVEPEPAPVVEPEPATLEVVGKELTVEPKKCFVRLDIRTNLLYDAMLLPTLGAELTFGERWGVKFDGSISRWGDSHGKVQKIWLVNPEVRWYLLDKKRFYVGASANFGEYNVYKNTIGNLFSSDTGYQGKLRGAGATVGYQLYLSHSFSLDFNLGLGYTKLDYDSFNMINGVRVYKDRDKTKNFWGPTQAGVNLIWTLGGNK